MMATRVPNPRGLYYACSDIKQNLSFGKMYVLMYISTHLTQSGEPDVLRFTGIVRSWFFICHQWSKALWFLQNFIHKNSSQNAWLVDEEVTVIGCYSDSRNSWKCYHVSLLLRQNYGIIRKNLRPRTHSLVHIV